MSALKYKHERTLELPALSGSRYRWRNLCVQVQRSSGGSYRAVLVDLEEFRGEGSGQSRAIDDLADVVERYFVLVPGVVRAPLPSWRQV